MSKRFIQILGFLLLFTILCAPAKAVDVRLDHQMTDPDEGITVLITSNYSDAEYTVVIGSKNRDIPFEVDTVVLNNGSNDRKYNLKQAEEYGHWYVIVFNKSLNESIEKEFYMVYSGPESKKHIDGLAVFFLNRQNDLMLIIVGFMVGLVAVITLIAFAYREKLRRMQGHATILLRLRQFAAMQTAFDPYDKNISDESMNPLERARWKTQAIEKHLERVFNTRKDYEELIGDFKAIGNVLLVLRKGLGGVREQYGPYQELIEKEAKLRAKWSDLMDEMNTEAEVVGIAKRDKSIEQLYEEMKDRRQRPIQITVESD